MPRRKPPPPKPNAIIFTLPPELLHKICSILPLHDLGNLRRTCKTLAEFSQRHLVKELHVMFTQKSWMNIGYISTSRQLRPHVRKIVYEPMMLEELDKEGWMGRLQDVFIVLCGECHHETCRVGCRNKSAREMPGMNKRLQGAWKVYSRKVVEQGKAIQTLDDYSHWKVSLPRFENLEQVVVRGCPNPTKSPWLEREYRESMAVEGYLTDGRVEHGDENSVRPLIGLISGLVLAGEKGVRLKHFKVTNLGWAFFDYALDSHTRPNPEYVVFTSLRTLHLHLSEDFDAIDIPEETTRRHKNLGALLKVTPLLETLHLNFGRPTRGDSLVLDEREFRLPILWSVIFSNVHWVKLHTLRLANLTCHTDAISSFLLSHSSTLRVLNLTSLWLHEPTLQWKTVFETMRSHLSLTKLFLDGNFGGEFTPGTGEPVYLALLNTCRHTTWLTKAIVYGKAKMEAIRQENEGTFREEEEIGRQKNRRSYPLPAFGPGVKEPGNFIDTGVCPLKYFMMDPVENLEHYGWGMDESGGEAVGSVVS